MPWSTEDPRPADPVLGDPASVAALAAVLHRCAADLRLALHRLPPASVGTSRRHASRVRALHAQARTVITSMERAGELLAEHAVVLAEATGLGRRLVDRAGALGLSVDGPVVARSRGVRGVADATTEQDRAAALERLQHVLDTILADLEVRRRELRADLVSGPGRRTSR